MINSKRKGAKGEQVDLVAQGGDDMRHTVLDACCGSRMFYFDKEDNRVLYCDNREELTTLCDGRKLIVRPDMHIDFRNMPFADSAFRLVIFDPPHLLRAGEKSWLRLKYGVLPKNWQTYIREGFDECWRVLQEGGTLVMKWSTDQIPATDMLKAIGQRPLIGDKRGKKRWYVFFKGRFNYEEN